MVLIIHFDRYFNASRAPAAVRNQSWRRTEAPHLLKVDLPQGPVWRRYNEDGYGEHEDGRPFDGGGIGRAWPLLTGERAHYELGRLDEAQRLLRTLEGCASTVGLIPEQVWDSEEDRRHRQPAHYGLFANTNRAENIATARALFDVTPPAADPQQQPDGTPDRHVCCLARARAVALA